MRSKISLDSVVRNIAIIFTTLMVALSVKLYLDNQTLIDIIDAQTKINRQDIDKIVDDIQNFQKNDNLPLHKQKSNNASDILREFK